MALLSFLYRVSRSILVGFATTSCFDISNCNSGINTVLHVMLIIDYEEDNSITEENFEESQKC